MNSIGEIEPEIKDEELIEFYRIYREKIVHEDNLVNHRSTWFLLFQGFLFTSSAIVLVGVLDAAADPSDWYRIAFICLGLIGISVSIATFGSIKAAQKSVNAAANRWMQVTTVQQQQQFPVIIGANFIEGRATRSGNWAGYCIPLVFTVYWLLILFVSKLSLLGYNVLGLFS